MGEAMVKNISDVFPLEMDKLAFQYGCIAPDFTKGLPDHTKEQSIHYVAALIRELQQTDLRHAKQDGNHDCFIKMGMISHYISDYFCLPHNDDQLYERFFPHILYENRLHFACTASGLLQMSRTGLEYYFDTLSLNKTSLLDYIDDRHAAYLANAPRISKDIQYAAETSMTIITAILDQQLPALREIAA